MPENQNRPGRSRAQQAAINRYWKGLPLRDATDNVLFVVSEDDIKGAVPGDPESCAIARTCKRTLDSTAVVIFHRVAYIDIPQKDGTREVLRFRIPPWTGEVIAALDSGREPRAGTYTFEAPSPSNQLDIMRAHSEANRVARDASTRRYVARRKAIINGEMEGLTTRGKRVLAAGDEGYIRSGTGRVQMHLTHAKV